MKHLFTRLSLFLSLCLLAWGPSFAEGSALPAINTPSPDSQLSTSNQTFTWEKNGTEATLWWLRIGSSVGSYDIYNSSEALSSDQLSVQVSGLPTDGSTLYVRLYYLTTDWEFIDIQYTAADIGASDSLLASKSSELTAGGGVVGTVERYTQSLATGDADELKSLLGGRLLQSRRVLLENNAEYPDKLRQFYDGANFAITATNFSSDQYPGSLLVDVEIAFPDGQKAMETLILQESTAGSSDWKVIDFVR